MTGRRMTLTLPPPRPIDWALRPLESAETELCHLRDGRRELRIRHAPLRGITPAMLRWWVLHIEGTVEVQGRTYPGYLVWHPRDHIHWELARPAPDGSAGVGARFRIVEAFGRNPAYLVDSVEEVERLDERGSCSRGASLEKRGSAWSTSSSMCLGREPHGTCRA